jgi:hypothetical protein
MNQSVCYELYSIDGDGETKSLGGKDHRSVYPDNLTAIGKAPDFKHDILKRIAVL